MTWEIPHFKNPHIYIYIYISYGFYSMLVGYISYTCICILYILYYKPSILNPFWGTPIYGNPMQATPEGSRFGPRWKTHGDGSPNTAPVTLQLLRMMMLKIMMMMKMMMMMMMKMMMMMMVMMKMMMVMMMMMMIR